MTDIREVITEVVDEWIADGIGGIENLSDALLSKFKAEGVMLLKWEDLFKPILDGIIMNRGNMRKAVEATRYEYARAYEEEIAREEMIEPIENCFKHENGTFTAHGLAKQIFDTFKAQGYMLIKIDDYMADVYLKGLSDDPLSSLEQG